MAKKTECTKCSGPLVTVQGHCIDSFFAEYDGKEYFGYVPRELGIGGGDDIFFSFCPKCGLIAVATLPVCGVEQLQKVFGEKPNGL